jgi:hypothetical protein
MVPQVSAQAQSRGNHHGRRGERVEKRKDATSVERAKRVQPAHAPLIEYWNRLHLCHCCAPFKDEQGVVAIRHKQNEA